MKTYIITLFAILLMGNFAIAGTEDNTKEKGNTSLISGKVIDKISGEEIAGVAIKIDDKVIYSDLNGNFFTSVNSTKTEALITFVSYNDLKLNIDLYGPVVIELESK